MKAPVVHVPCHLQCPDFVLNDVYEREVNDNINAVSPHPVLASVCSYWIAGTITCYVLCTRARSLGMRAYFRIGLRVGIKQNSNRFLAAELEVSCSIFTVVSCFLLVANV